jgi:23S rRNA pseudouridine1911/1915/1917 synthase
MINPEYIGPDIKTLYEDDIFLVIDKPANIFVHPLSYEEKNNFLSFLRVNKPELLSINQTQYDRGLLYRLDFETSGVLIYVKNAIDHQYLREHFEACAKKKIYYAIVDGRCPLSGKFVHYFSSSEVKGRRVIVSDRQGCGIEQSGELVILSAQELSDSDATLIEIELRTGLRHQIRAQLSHLKFPIRGDGFYAGKSASRLYLHAYKYELNYKEKYYQFNAQPSDFNGK